MKIYAVKCITISHINIKIIQTTKYTYMGITNICFEILLSMGKKFIKHYV